jgi:hypothetical protein
MDNRQHYLKAFLLSGLVAGLLSAAPGFEAGNCCCLWAMLGGLGAGWLLCRSAEHPVGSGEGGLVGLLSGITGGLVMGVVSAVKTFLNPARVQTAFSQFQQSGNFKMPPEAQVFFEQMMKVFSNPSVSLGIGVFFWVIIFAIIGMLGGTLAVSFFEPGFARSRAASASQIGQVPVTPVQTVRTVNPDVTRQPSGLVSSGEGQAGEKVSEPELKFPRR